jgi:hypothetical protein
MPTEKQRKAINLYASLMEEAKARMAAIDATLGGKTQLEEIFGDEFCTLQLRMLCELIALGCLVAHGDIQATQTGRLQKEYSAEKICERLEKLHADFYPHPVRQVAPNPPHHLGLEDIVTGYLTKTELVRLVGRCGNVLHRGSAKTLLSPRVLGPAEIAAWTLKIRTLLDIHWFALVSGEPHYLCSMTGGEDGGVGVEFVPKRN